MKKVYIIILASLALINANLFAMQKKEAVENQASKAKFSIQDTAKIAVASVGFAWFSIAALATPYALKYDTPGTPFGWPFGYTAGFLYEHVFSKLDPDIDMLNLNLLFATTGITSAILASAFGGYIYKKLSTLKTKIRLRIKMKKIIILLFSLIACTTDTFGMIRKQEIKEQHNHTQFTKKDWAKVIAASIGCGCFLTSALAIEPTVKAINNGGDFPLVSFPLSLTTFPCMLGFVNILGYKDDNPTFTKSVKLGGITSAILATGLSVYIGYKLAALRASKSQKCSNADDV